MSSLQQQKQYTKQYILPLLNDEEAGSNKHLLWAITKNKKHNPRTLILHIFTTGDYQSTQSNTINNLRVAQYLFGKLRKLSCKDMELQII